MTNGCLRRVAQVMVIAFLTTIGLLAVSPPASACACGGIVNPAGRSTTVTGETALIALNDDRETIVMSLSAHSDATRAGLLVPTPAPATPKLADRAVFSDLARQTAPRERIRHHLFGPPAIFTGHDDSDNGAAPAGAPDSGVQVLGDVDLGPLRAVSLTASNAADLHVWLKKHDFVMSPKFESLVTPYLKEGWAFTAMSLTPKGKSLSGELPPVSLSFASRQLVYPMRMSHGAKDSQHVTTYVLADHRVARTDPTAAHGTLQTVYADTLRTDQVGSDALRQLATGNTWLTEFTQDFNDPAHQVRSDFTFARAADDKPVVTYDDTDEYFIPVDVAALLAVVVLAAGAGVVVLLRRRSAVSRAV